MKPSTPDDDALFLEAMDLVIRLQNDADNAVSADLARRWRQRSPDHERAWRHATDMHCLAGQAVASRRAKMGRVPALGLSRRTVLFGAGSAMAAAAIGAVYVPPMILRARADFVTETAEVRNVPLPDGSMATLGPDSAIRLQFSDRQRNVELLTGSAFFEVAKDADRPFRATSNGFAATALGTAFDLSDDDGVLSLSVEHGRVEARMPDTPLAAGLELIDGDWLRFEAVSQGLEQGTRATDEIAAWRRGLVVADREKISAVVTRIRRWHPGRIVFADPSLGSRRISGLFDLSKPLPALAAVVEPYGGKVRQVSPWLTVISPI